MFKKIFFAVFIAFFIFSCNSYKIAGRMKQIELGMTKTEVTEILGKNYTSKAAGATREGNFETLEYFDQLNEGWYILTFLDGKLVEWINK